MGALLRTSLPPRVRTALLKDVTSSLGHAIDPGLTVALLRLNIIADVTHLEIRGQEGEDTKLLEEKCKVLMEEMQDMEELRLESLQLEGVSVQPGVLSCILKKAPRLRSLQVSGTLADEALQHLSSNICELHSLHLHSCTVTDEDVVSALVQPHMTLGDMAEVIWSDEDVTKSGRVRASSLKRVTIISPSLSLGGAMVLLRTLPHLQDLHYTWLVPVCESLRLLQQLCPTVTSYAISHLDLSLVSTDMLTGLATLCPGLRSLQIEGFDSSVVHLDALADFTRLTSLSLRLVPEPFIVSAVRAVGHNLLKLRIEYEECVFKLISFAALKTLQEYCRELRSLELVSVCLAGEPQPRMASRRRSPAFPELTRLVVAGAASSQGVLAGLMSGNRSLEYLSLEVNQDVLTDHVVQTLLAQNDLQRLATLHLGAGSLSPAVITDLLTLPSLANFTMDVNNFKLIPEATFISLQENLRRNNCLCRLERSAAE